jgi:hypothetical protein
MNQPPSTPVSRIQGGLMLLPPALTILLASFPAISLTAGICQKGFDIVSLLVVLPFWLGVMASPGVIFASLTSPGTGMPFGVRASIVLGLVASIGGAVASIPIMVPVPFALASAGSCIVLLRRL